MTPTTGRRARNPRAEPIIVGEDLSHGLLRDVREALAPRDIRVVDSLFEAVENTGSLAHVSAILMAPSSGFNDHEIVEAFRKVDPSVRLILLIGEGEDSRGRNAIEKGFDAAVNPTRDLELVAAAIDGTGDPEALHRKLINRQSIPASEMKPQEKTGLVEHSVVERVLDESFERANREELASDAKATHGKGLKGMIPREDESRMVNAMIENRDIQPIGLEIIRQRTGIEDLQFIGTSMEEERARAGDRGATILAIPGNEGVLGFFITDDPKDGPLLASWIQWLASWLTLQKKNVTLLEQAWTDHLTGAGNRRALENVLERVIARSDRTWRFMSLMCFDIDNFKKYNDKYGHAAGDEVLRETVLLVKTAIRKGDHVFRVGGDEFVVVFSDPAARADQSQPLVHEKIARRIQSSMAKLALPNIGPESPERISISSGLVTYPWDVLNLPGEGTPIEKLLSLGDQRALESKRSGKNKITLGPETDR
jgi:diguanylate cyclase (GGDEF)-like protein